MRLLVRHTYLWIKKRRINRFLAAAPRCREIQQRVLLKKIRRNADSDFGRDHGFATIRSSAEFQRRVPVAGYEYYRPYIERVKQGEMHALFGPTTKVLMFSMTSGTTSASKYIPITNHFYGEYRKSWNLWGLGVFRDHTDLLTKRTIQLSSDWRQFFTDSGIPCGNVSGLAAETRPRIARPAFILPPVVSKISGSVNKQYVVLRLMVPISRIGMMVTANPLTLLNVARLADSRRESLVRDIQDGTLTDDIEIPDHVRKSLEPALKQRHPKRARELESIIERTGHFYPRDFWPLMSVLSVWIGGSMGIYLPMVREYYGNASFRDHGLSASEGRMTTPLKDGTSAGVLDYVTHYFEFIPEEEHDHDNPTVLEAHELQPGENYFILLTTSSGLYRYDIHDVVKCVGFAGACPVLDFMNKGAHYSSMAGEKISESQVATSIASAFADLGLAVEHSTLAPVADAPPHYTLLTELRLPPRQARQLAQRIDLHLSRANCEFEDRLASFRLNPTTVRRVDDGTFAALREHRVSGRGGSAEQYKHPWLVNQTDFVDQLLKLKRPVRPVCV